MEDFEKQEQTELETNTDNDIVNENVESVAETVEEAAPSDIVNENAEPADAAELPGSEDGEAVEAQETDEIPAKKSALQKPIIIAACILVVALIAAGVYFFFFNNGITGTWVYDDKTSTADEASTEKKADENTRYYTFNNDGTAAISLGTIEITGTWEYSSDSSSSADQKGNQVNITILPIISGTFDYKVEGNMFTGKKLTLTTNNTPLEFNSAQKTTPDLKVSKKFKAEKSVTGSWKNKDFNYIYTFNADGTCHLKTGDQISTTGTYTIDTKKKQITIVYVGEKKAKMYLTYESGKKNKELTLSGYKFTKVNE